MVCWHSLHAPCPSRSKSSPPLLSPPRHRITINTYGATINRWTNPQCDVHLLYIELKAGPERGAQCPGSSPPGEAAAAATAAAVGYADAAPADLAPVPLGLPSARAVLDSLNQKRQRTGSTSRGAGGSAVARIQGGALVPRGRPCGGSGGGDFGGRAGRV